MRAKRLPLHRHQMDQFVLNSDIFKISKLSGPRLLPLKKAAEYLGLTVWGMRERIWAGDIPVVRFQNGRKMFVDVMDLEGLIQKNKVTIV